MMATLHTYLPHPSLIPSPHTPNSKPPYSDAVRSMGAWNKTNHTQKIHRSGHEIKYGHNLGVYSDKNPTMNKHRLSQLSNMGHAADKVNIDASGLKVYFCQFGSTPAGWPLNR